jgi:hypothetical protein
MSCAGTRKTEWHDNGVSGPRRSRRFNVETAAGLGISCDSRPWTRKRAGARAPSPH